MDRSPRRDWITWSGLTRREQQVLIFLICVIAAGLIYGQLKGGRRRDSLELHRGQMSQPDQVLPVGPGGLEQAEPTSPSAAKTGDSPMPSATPALLDLNNATVEQLEDLPQIGPKRAESIVRYRETHGPFARIEDLAQVAGIGDKTVEALRPYLKPLGAGAPPASPTPLSMGAPGQREPKSSMTSPKPAPAKVNINTATIEELCTLDGIGMTLAQRIVEYRRTKGAFRSPAEIMNVRGIGRSVYEKNRLRLEVWPLSR